MVCRNCGGRAETVFADLGVQPLANGYLKPEHLDEPETFYPLRPVVCGECRLVQLLAFASPERVFGEYPFFSGQSAGWVKHCYDYASEMLKRFDVPRRVLEIASNDGTLLRQFQHYGLGVLGVEPALNVAWDAQLHGIPTVPEFFGVELAMRLRGGGYVPDLIVANNVLAHVPDLDDFLGGIELLLAPDGIVTFEVPHVAALIEQNAFDQVYHEHLSYFSMCSVAGALGHRGLRAFDVEQLDIHGGSLRIYACHLRTAAHDTGARPAQLMRSEQDQGYWDLDTYAAYASEPPKAKAAALQTLSALRADGKTIAGYGAPAKGNTWINYCGLGPETIEFVVDSTPAKQGTFLPGSRIPVLAPEALTERKPDVVVILPWNWSAEITSKIERDCDWQPDILCRPGIARKVPA